MKIGSTNNKIFCKKKGKKLEKLIGDKFSHKIDEMVNTNFSAKGNEALFSIKQNLAETQNVAEN